MNPPDQLYGAIEAGGTKFVCAIGDSEGAILAETRFPTAAPPQTIERAVAFFREHHLRGRFAALGIASFGPVDPRRSSPDWGHITSTPKPGWRMANLAGPFEQALGIPVGFDTDVNGAALGELRFGAGRGLDALLYVTVGTGIGGGFIIGGRPLHGLLHPEMGHIRLPRSLDAQPFAGVCPFHGDCLEGVASGLAMEKRWGAKAEDLPDNHIAWEIEAEHLALACANWILTLSPERIILGGGVMQRRALFPRICERTLAMLAGYVQSPRILAEIDSYIVPPMLGAQSGVKGALVLAEQALRLHQPA